MIFLRFNRLLYYYVYGEFNFFALFSVLYGDFGVVDADGRRSVLGLPFFMLFIHF